VNELHVWLRSEPARVEFASERYSFYRRVRRFVQLSLGLMRSTMLHDTPLDFIWLGVMLERVGQTARYLDVHHHALNDLTVHPVVQTALWLSLLRGCSGFEPFMKRHQGRVSGDAVAAFLVLEPKFPRSVRYCVRAAYERLCAIRPPQSNHLPGGAALAELEYLDRWLTERKAVELEEGRIHDVLTRIVDSIDAAGDRIGAELLGYGPLPAAASQ
jgi:uncharacterized alpha-E superfamily protein